LVSRSSIAALWDGAADSFDDEPDHGLADPRVRAAWAAALDSWLPGPPADVVDLGCGTGSLSSLLGERGHRTVGVDLSANMVRLARHKLGADASLLVGDASQPPLGEHTFDVVLARHLLWTLPDPVDALRRWIALCRPGGRLVLVEGRWAGADEDYLRGELPWTGGVTARTLTDSLRPHVSAIRTEPLVDPDLWGRTIDDERYVVIASVGHAQ
jgi:ubiquinone/menaquinone biosynthesis C-methylase UbiE